MFNRKANRGEKQRRAALNFIKDHPGCTRRDLAQHIGVHNQEPGSVCRIVNRLIVLGEIEETGRSYNHVTGRWANRLFPKKA